MFSSKFKNQLAEQNANDSNPVPTMDINQENNVENPMSSHAQEPMEYDRGGVSLGKMCIMGKIKVCFFILNNFR